MRVHKSRVISCCMAHRRVQSSVHTNRSHIKCTLTRAPLLPATRRRQVSRRPSDGEAFAQERVQSPATFFSAEASMHHCVVPPCRLSLRGPLSHHSPSAYVADRLLARGGSILFPSASHYQASVSVCACARLEVLACLSSCA